MSSALTMCFVIFFTIIATTTSCSRKSELYLEGQGQAERDLKNGLFNMSEAESNNVPAYPEYMDLLHKRYGIGWCESSLPGDPRAAEEWVRGYNEVALPKIEQKLGAEVLKQTMADAQKAHDLSKGKN